MALEIIQMKINTAMIIRDAFFLPTIEDRKASIATPPITTKIGLMFILHSFQSDLNNLYDL
jgi:hypothetical protein